MIIVAIFSSTITHSLFSLGRACAGYSLMNDVHLSVLQRLASQASVVMDVVFSMASILPAYHTSYHHLQSLFLSFIEQAGRYIHSSAL